jgi:hypothetical protein
MAMTAPDMSPTCEEFIRCVIQGVPKLAFRYASQLEDRELFRAFAVLAREELQDLFDKESQVSSVSLTPGLSAAQRAVQAASFPGTPNMSANLSPARNSTQWPEAVTDPVLGACRRCYMPSTS